MTVTPPQFTIRSSVPLRPATVLERIFALRAHARVIPLTTVRPELSFADLEPGTTFVARTGVGPFGFDDRMTVTHIHRPDGSPGSIRIRKEGRVLRGEIRVVARPTPTGSELTWRQTVDLPWLPRFVSRLAAPVLRLGYAAVIGRLLASPAPDEPAAAATQQR